MASSPAAYWEIPAETLKSMGFQKVTTYVVPLNAAMKQFEISTSPRQAAFLANVAVETSWLGNITVENGNYTLAQARGANLSRVINATPAQIDALFDGTKDTPPENRRVKSEEDFFNFVYATSNGNNKAGDGSLYRGRGIIQITGRSIYSDVANAIGRPEILATPGLIVSDPTLACPSGAAYWKIKGLNIVADGGKLESMQKTSEIVNKFASTKAKGDKVAAWYKLMPILKTRDEIAKLKQQLEALQEQLRAMSSTSNTVNQRTKGRGR